MGKTPEKGTEPRVEAE